MGFYNIPIVVSFLTAILVACLQNRSVPFEEKLALMGQGIGDKNIITMLLIFLAAGTFVGVVGRSSADNELKRGGFLVDKKNGNFRTRELSIEMRSLRNYFVLDGEGDDTRVMGFVFKRNKLNIDG